MTDAHRTLGPVGVSRVMGFQQHIVVRSAVSADVRRSILSAALTRWQFARCPHKPDSYPDRVVFAPPELMGYQFSGVSDEVVSRKQNADLLNHGCWVVDLVLGRE